MSAALSTATAEFAASASQVSGDELDAVWACALFGRPPAFTDVRLQGCFTRLQKLRDLVGQESAARSRRVTQPSPSTELGAKNVL